MIAEKITEFLFVLVFALVVGTCAMLSILYLSGVAQAFAILATLVIALAAWQYLRKRFGRT